MTIINVYAVSNYYFNSLSIVYGILTIVIQVQVNLILFFQTKSLSLMNVYSKHELVISTVWCLFVNLEILLSGATK